MSRLIQVTRHVILFAWFESLNNNFFIELLMKKELQALTLVGPTSTKTPSTSYTTPSQPTIYETEWTMVTNRTFASLFCSLFVWWIRFNTLIWNSPLTNLVPK